MVSLEEKISCLKKNIPRRIEIRVHKPETGLLGTVFSRGGRRKTFRI